MRDMETRRRVLVEARSSTPSILASLLYSYIMPPFVATHLRGGENT
jgi:hypothetical protein